METNGDGKIGNTIQSSRVEAYKWFMTFNNYKKHGYNGDMIYEKLKLLVKKLCMQEEIGECGTPHLQANMTFIKKIRLTALKKVICDQVNWRQTNNDEAANAYCLKENTRAGKQWTIGMPRPINVITELRPFQCDLEDMLELKPDDRTIIWIYDPIGNMGKTQFLKYMNVKHGAVFSYGGKKADIINLVFNNKEYLLEHVNPIMFYSFPRDIDPKCISYESMEQIKDGCISNTKFEAGCFCCNSPHVVVLANCLPIMSKLTSDRWDIRSIDEAFNLVFYDVTEGLDVCPFPQEADAS